MKTFYNANSLFEQAIQQGVLSYDPTAPNYAGKYMYMQSNGSIHYFKNIDTRKYIEIIINPFNI